MNICFLIYEFSTSRRLALCKKLRIQTFQQMEVFLVKAFRGDAVAVYREPRITKTREASVWPVE